jgi:hypothetical protein
LSCHAGWLPAHAARRAAEHPAAAAAAEQDAQQDAEHRPGAGDQLLVAPGRGVHLRLVDAARRFVGLPLLSVETGLVGGGELRDRFLG